LKSLDIIRIILVDKTHLSQKIGEFFTKKSIPEKLPAVDPNTRVAD